MADLAAPPKKPPGPQPPAAALVAGKPYPMAKNNALSLGSLALSFPAATPAVATLGLVTESGVKIDLAVGLDNVFRLTDSGSYQIYKPGLITSPAKFTLAARGAWVSSDELQVELQQLGDAMNTHLSFQVKNGQMSLIQYWRDRVGTKYTLFVGP